MDYKRINSKHNAKNAIREIMGFVDKKDLTIVIYDLGENHVVCASDEGGPTAVQKYQLSDSTANAIQNDATNHFPIAALCYNLRKGEVYLLDAVPELAVANCLLLCVMNILLAAESCGCKCKEETEPRKSIDEPYVAAKPRKTTLALRDESGMFLGLKEATEQEESTIRRFSLNGLSRFR